MANSLIKKIFAPAAIAMIGLFLVLPLPTLAGECTCPGDPPVESSSQASCTALCGSNGTGTYTDTPATGGGTTSGGTPTAGKLTNPLSEVCSDKTTGQQCVQLIIGNIIKAALGIVGSIALLMLTYGGYRWLTAMGNSEKVEKGKDTVIWAALGLTLIFGAYAITNYIITKLLSGGK